MFNDVQAYQGEIYKYGKGHILKRELFPDKLNCPECKSISTFSIYNPGKVVL